MNDYIIVEIIPRSRINGYIVQLQALKKKNNKIIDRMDYRLNEKLINNIDILNMIQYDKDLFTYVDDHNSILEIFKLFSNGYKILYMDDNYTENYLKDLNNEKESILKKLGMEYSYAIYEKIINKYKLEYSNHFVDLLYEALVFEGDK